MVCIQELWRWGAQSVKAFSQRYVRSARSILGGVRLGHSVRLPIAGYTALF